MLLVRINALYPVHFRYKFNTAISTEVSTELLKPLDWQSSINNRYPIALNDLLRASCIVQRTNYNHYDLLNHHACFWSSLLCLLCLQLFWLELPCPRIRLFGECDCCGEIQSNTHIINIRQVTPLVHNFCPSFDSMHVIFKIVVCMCKIVLVDLLGNILQVRWFCSMPW